MQWVMEFAQVPLLWSRIPSTCTVIIVVGASIVKETWTCCFQFALGGPWDLVTVYKWAYSPTYNPPKRPYKVYPKYKQGYK